jgi:hypothetical protein
VYDQTFVHNPHIYYTCVMRLTLPRLYPSKNVCCGVQTTRCSI